MCYAGMVLGSLHNVSVTNIRISPGGSVGDVFGVVSGGESQERWMRVCMEV